MNNKEFGGETLFDFCIIVISLDSAPSRLGYDCMSGTEDTNAALRPKHSSQSAADDQE
jgi:hypothetical protein